MVPHNVSRQAFQEAFEQAVGELFVKGACTLLQEGTPITVHNVQGVIGAYCVRPEGGTECLWTARVFVTPRFLRGLIPPLIAVARAPASPGLFHCTDLAENGSRNGRPSRSAWHPLHAAVSITT
jgi:hypothetical protein